MIEISCSFANDDNSSANSQLPAVVGYGGDTLNTALYLSRLGADVDYVSALGQETTSDWLLTEWQREGIGCQWIQRTANKVPGLYMIEVDEEGERKFHYWRDQSPAKALFSDAKAIVETLNSLIDYQYIYLSGISLALFSEAAFCCLVEFLNQFRNNGGKVIFDSNYRPQLWTGKSHTRDAYSALYSLTDIALPTLEDEIALYEEHSNQSVVDRIQSYGVKEIILKMGSQGCLAVEVGTKPTIASKNTMIPTVSVPVVDTTAAGDSFNAGYLAARLSGVDMIEAAKQGQKLAAKVIQHKGAVIPLSLM